MLLTPSVFKESYDTDLQDGPIQGLLDDAEAEIDKIFGAALTHTDWLAGRTRNLFLSRAAASITTVVETIALTDTTLASDDFELQHNGKSILRKWDGTNGRLWWGDRAKIIFVPVSDVKQRKRVQIDLVKLAIQYDGLQRSAVGNQTLVMGDYEGARREILSRLGPTLAV